VVQIEANTLEVYGSGFVRLNRKGSGGSTISRVIDKQWKPNEKIKEIPQSLKLSSIKGTGKRC
jgi:hypothetical protein